MSEIDVSKYNLSWKLVNFKNNSMHIQLDIFNPMYISLRKKRDEVVMNVKNLTEAFFCLDPKVNDFLHKDYRVLRHRIKKQLPRNEFTMTNMATAET